MTRFLPFPLFSLFLLVVWLLLNQTTSFAQIVLGSVLAVVGGWTLKTVEPPTGRPRRPVLVVQLGLTVLVDILRSNLAVARIVLGLARPASSGFVRIPLDMTNRYGLAVLALIITATPGTVWVDYDFERRILIIHVLDLVDEDSWIHTIKHRYERQLMEIFE